MASHRTHISSRGSGGEQTNKQTNKHNLLYVKKEERTVGAKNVTVWDGCTALSTLRLDLTWRLCDAPLAPLTLIIILCQPRPVLLLHHLAKSKRNHDSTMRPNLPQRLTFKVRTLFYLFFFPLSLLASHWRNNIFICRKWTTPLIAWRNKSTSCN